MRGCGGVLRWRLYISGRESDCEGFSSKRRLLIGREMVGTSLFSIADCFEVSLSVPPKDSTRR